MQKVVRVDGDCAVPELLLNFLKPLVLGALALVQLSHALYTCKGPAQKSDWPWLMVGAGW